MVVALGETRWYISHMRKLRIDEICSPLGPHIWFPDAKPYEVCLCGAMWLYGGDLLTGMRLPVPQRFKPNAAMRFGIMSPFIEDE